MALQKSVFKCTAKHDCQKIYHQLGKAKDPSVAWKITIVFLLPLLVLIGTLVLFHQFFTNTIDEEGLRTAVSFLLSVLATSVYIFLVVLIGKQVSKNK